MIKVTKTRIPGPWAPVSRDLLSSDAWRSLSINSRRLIDFLLIQHMNKGGQENGKLKAPQHQLEEFGIGARHISGAILEAEERGLVECHRGGMRVATNYTLAWLPTVNGTAPTDRWRTYRNANLRPLPRPKSRNLPSEGRVELPSEGKADGQNLPSEGKADRPKSLPSEGKALLRKDSYQGGGGAPPLTVVGGRG